MSAKHPRFSNRGVLVTLTEGSGARTQSRVGSAERSASIADRAQTVPSRGVLPPQDDAGRTPPTLMSRGATGSVSNDYVKLLLGREEGKRDKYLISLRTTANYYGWTKEFEEWAPKPINNIGKYQLFIDPGRKWDLRMHGGRRHYICRSPVTGGYPKGMTNAFKVSRTCGLLDLAELAHFTDIEWHWMSSPYGERISRDHWERIYQSGIPGRRGVAVSA